MARDSVRDDTKNVEEVGLNGTCRRPIKITMLGAGSGFTEHLMKDIVLIPGSQGGEIALVDIDPARLAIAEKLVNWVIGQVGKSDSWTVTAHTDRRDALADSDYVVNCIEVSGVDCVRHDNDIPLKYGVDQCIGDTIGPGGLFKGLRTIPVFLEVLWDAEELCEDALVLNYTNPMSMMCLAAARSSHMEVVGLCHSVQGTSHQLAHWADCPYEEMVWECAGVNHLAWFTKLERDGEDLYPILMEKASEEGGPFWEADPVRCDMMLHFGAFITESSGHLSEYVPYYRKRKDALKRYCRESYLGGSSFYADNWPTWRKDCDARRLRVAAGEEAMELKRSWEYASWIVEAREKDVPFRVHGTVPNDGSLISNLPGDGVVEVACMIDANGINPTRYGYLPAHMAAVCAMNMPVYDLGATAAIERSKEAAIHALMLDPLTMAVCTPAEVKQMVLELFDAEAQFLPDYE
jgi:alpha-galactosidase